MSDIVPALLESIESDFTKRLEQDTMLSELGKIIGSGQATFEAASDYSKRLGELLSGVLREHISADMLPDGRMYYNIAERVLRPMLSNNYELAADAAAQVQQSLNRAAGLGLKAIKPAPDMDRITGIVDKVSVAENFERVSWMLDEPVTNFTMSAVEDTIRENVDFHGRAGLKPTITRVATSTCCEWCSQMAGKYDYPVDREVYQRHEYCRCLVLYDPGDGRVQDAHSKIVYESQAKAERDARVARAEKLANEKGLSLTPQQREARIKAITTQGSVMDLSTGETYKLVGRIQDRQVFAGRGSKTPYRNAEKYAEIYGGRAENWQHVKGVGLVDTPDGQFKAEIHWSAVQGFDHVDMFIKRWIDEG